MLDYVWAIRDSDFNYLGTHDDWFPGIVYARFFLGKLSASDKLKKLTRELNRQLFLVKVNLVIADEQT